MAITAVKILIKDPGDVVVTATSDGQYMLTENWGVTTNQGAAKWNGSNPLFFHGDPLFPAIGAGHPRNSNLLFKTFQSATQMNSNYWVFSGMQFITDLFGFSPLRFNDLTPDDAQRSWAFNALSKVMWSAYVADPTGPTKFNRPLDATAFPFSANQEPVAVKETGEPIAGLTRTRYVPVCTYTRNELNPPPALLTDPLPGTVNTDVITIDGLSVPAGTCLIQDVKISDIKRSVKSNGTTTLYRTIVYVLAIDTEGWDVDVLQRGYYAINNNSSKRIEVSNGLDQNGKKNKPRPTSTAQLIDVNGYWIDTSPDTGSPTWRDNVHYRVFRVHRYAALGSLNFS